MKKNLIYIIIFLENIFKINGNKLINLVNIFLMNFKVSNHSFIMFNMYINKEISLLINIINIKNI
jgi:hypothetical protein